MRENEWNRKILTFFGPWWYEWLLGLKNCRWRWRGAEGICDWNVGTLASSRRCWKEEKVVGRRIHMQVIIHCSKTPTADRWAVTFCRLNGDSNSTTSPWFRKQFSFLPIKSGSSAAYLGPIIKVPFFHTGISRIYSFKNFKSFKSCHFNYNFISLLLIEHLKFQQNG